MKLDDHILKYLNGSEFESSLRVSLTKEKCEIISREDAIIKIVEGKSVIHIGCSDHLKVIDEKIKNNTWLHKLLTDKASRCIGIDLNSESIDYISNELGYDNVYQGDILINDFPQIKSNKWDFAVFGELIEHLDDPVNFLKVFKTKYGEQVENFIITVPSIYNMKQFSNMMNYYEIINSDHRFWFTPYTISKIIVSAGYCPQKIYYVNLQALNFWRLALRKIKIITGMKVAYPFYYFKTILITGSFKQ